MPDDLQKLRTEIDQIDDELLKLISRRAQLAQTIGRLKQGNIYRPEREAQVLRRIKEANPGPLSGETAARLFREIMSACLALEQPLTVAYLGPQGTFTQAAAIKHFGHAAETADCVSIDEVFRKVESGQAVYAVAPVENSTEGAIGRTLDLLLNTPLMICGEVVVRVHHYLLRKGESMEGITKLYSHAQSFAQCHEWLNKNLPNVARITVSSNAEAARLAAAEPDSAAIAGETAAEIYGLTPLARNIEDEPNNTTRFLVLGMHDAGRSGRDKTSLVMAAPNQPGAMHDLLGPFARNGVSMTKLESRPSGAGKWEYVFYVDVEGHQEDAPVATALAELKNLAPFLKVLGSYPVAVL
ncbi:MAG: prephenate dehydratase [Hydrogenophilales bacterium]|nr:prephenate dehydratase [Hydrogenophilales bacterium]